MPTLLRLIVLFGYLLIHPGSLFAGSILEYAVSHGGHSGLQTVTISNGEIVIKAAGGDSSLDIVFEQTGKRLTLVDHRRQRYTPVTEEAIAKLAGQVEDVTPLLRGLGEQLRGLDARQRAKWEKMLGGFPLDAFAVAQHTLQGITLEAAGTGKEIAGVPCKSLQLKGERFHPMALCIADPGMLGLSAHDTAAVQSLVAVAHAVAVRAHGLASRLGLALSNQHLDTLAGVPVEIRELKGTHPLSMTLKRKQPTTVEVAPYHIPENYPADRLRLW